MKKKKIISNIIKGGLIGFFLSISLLGILTIYATLNIGKANWALYEDGYKLESIIEIPFPIVKTMTILGMISGFVFSFKRSKR